MKEAGTNPDQDKPAPSSGQEPGNGKSEKDMKGLVYQGGEPIQSGDSSSYQGDEAPPEEPKPAKTNVQSTESDILTFTEKDSRVKVIALVIIAIVIIAVVAYLVINSKLLSFSPAKKTTVTTTVASSNTPSTTTIVPNHNKSVMINLDVLYQYSGPSSINGTNCNKNSVSDVSPYSATFNASSTFLLYNQQSSGRCPLTITKITATTPGFKIVSSTPSTPVSIPASSSVYMILTISTPPTNYTGPLSLTISET